MLLTILNLPANVKYCDIKALVQSKCHIDDLILDNLAPYEKNTKKITIGVSSEEDAAAVMRNINGLHMDGRQLVVTWKTKTSDPNLNKMPTVALPSMQSSAPDVPSPMLNMRPQASNWFNCNYKIRQPVLGNQNPTPMIPPLLNVNSQTAYYQMNQPSYATPSTSSTEKVAYPELQSYGTKRYQNDWSSYNWNQQFCGFSNPEVTKNVKSRWDNPEAKYSEPQWGNNSVFVRNNNTDSNQSNDRNSNNSRAFWVKDNDSKWSTNQQSKRGDSRDFKLDRSSVSKIYSRPGTNRDINRDSNRSNRSFHQHSDPRIRYDSSHRNDGQNSAGSGLSYNSPFMKMDQDRTRSQRDSYVRNDQNNAASSRHGSSSARNDRYDTEIFAQHLSTTRNDRNYTRPCHDSDQNNGKSSRHNSPYNKNGQGNLRVAPHDSLYIRNHQNNVAPSFSHVYGDHVNASIKRVRNERPRQNESNAGSRPMFNRHLSPPMKRSRFSNMAGTQPGNKNIVFEQKKVPKQNVLNTGNNNKAAQQGSKNKAVEQIQDITTPWRAQISRTVAKRTMIHKCCTYEGVDKVKLHNSIVLAVRDRLNSNLRKKKYISAKQMAQIYYSKFDHASHCVLIKEAVEALGGKMLFQKNIPGGDGFLDQKLIPKTEAPAKTKTSLPLAQQPGRIPHYPQGDKKIFKKNKKESAKLFVDTNHLGNLMSSLPPAIKKAIEVETTVLSNVIKGACVFTEPNVADVSQHFKYSLPAKMKHITEVNLIKRMLPLLPVQIAAFSTPKVNRVELENYLKAYDVCSLKKCKNKPFYLIDCNSIDDHDKLCYKGTVCIGQSMVSFKPFHLIGALKVTKNDIARQRNQFKSMQLEYFDKIFNKTPSNDSEVVEKPLNDEGNITNDVKIPIKKEVEIKEENLCQDIEQVYDEINYPVNVKMENNSNTPFINTEINDGDFSNDVDFDNFGKDDNGYLPVGQVGATNWNDEVGTNIGNENIGINCTNVGDKDTGTSGTNVCNKDTEICDANVGNKDTEICDTNVGNKDTEFSGTNVSNKDTEISCINVGNKNTEISGTNVDNKDTEVSGTNNVDNKDTEVSGANNVDNKDTEVSGTNNVDNKDTEVFGTNNVDNKDTETSSTNVDNNDTEMNEEKPEDGNELEEDKTVEDIDIADINEDDLEDW